MQLGKGRIKQFRESANKWIDWVIEDRSDRGAEGVRGDRRAKGPGIKGVRGSKRDRRAGARIKRKDVAVIFLDQIADFTPLRFAPTPTPTQPVFMKRKGGLCGEQDGRGSFAF